MVLEISDEKKEVGGVFELRHRYDPVEGHSFTSARGIIRRDGIYYPFDALDTEEQMYDRLYRPIATASPEERPAILRLLSRVIGFYRNLVRRD